MNLAYTPEQLSAFWGAVSAIATVVAAAIAVVTLLALRRDSADRTRPLMSADIRPALLVRGVHELIVENVGKSVAKNVKVSFTPDLPDLGEQQAIGKVTLYLKRRYSEPLPTVPPRRQFTNLYFVGSPDPTGRFVNTEPLPDEIQVSFAYQDTRGKAYSDTYDLKVIWGASSTNPSDTDPKKLQERLTKALEVVAQAMTRR